MFTSRTLVRKVGLNQQNRRVNMNRLDEEGVIQKEKMVKRDNEILEAIKKFYLKHKNSPTVHEISKWVGINSTATVLRYLNRLQKQRRIDWEERTPRTIHILEQKESSAF